MSRDPLTLSAITPAELATAVGWSERRVRDKARELGACRILGNRMILLPQDVDTIMEATKCPSSSTGAARSGIIAGRLPVRDYEDLVRQRTKPLRRERPPKSKQTNGNVISMDPNRS
jgi:hypothetical protein